MSSEHDQNISGPSTTTGRARGRRGFAAMDPELQRQLSRKGGLAAHAVGHAHEFDSTTAKAAAMKRLENERKRAPHPLAERPGA